MVKENLLTSESFEMLLSWLNPEQEEAGHKYEKIRQRLIRFFIGRGCFEAEELADETINRVTHKLPQLIENYVGEPTSYFYGVADKVHLEWLRKEKKKRNLQIPNINYGDETEFELEYECLETCLEALPNNQREIILEYYSEAQKAKVINRKQLAKKLGISTSALHVKTCRIRTGLLQCVLNCVSAKIFRKV